MATGSLAPIRSEREDGETPVLSKQGYRRGNGPNIASNADDLWRGGCREDDVDSWGEISCLETVWLLSSAFHPIAFDSTRGRRNLETSLTFENVFRTNFEMKFFFFLFLVSQGMK